AISPSNEVALFSMRDILVFIVSVPLTGTVETILIPPSGDLVAGILPDNKFIATFGSSFDTSCFGSGFSHCMRGFLLCFSGNFSSGTATSPYAPGAILSRIWDKALDNASANPKCELLFAYRNKYVQGML